MSKELKPCPFCGYPVDLRQVVSFGGHAMGFFICPHCATISGFGNTIQKSIQNWNRRVEIPPQEQIPICLKRPSKDDYYLNIAEAVLTRSTCLRRKYGAVIVKDDEIISTGYNGSPRGAKNCCDVGYCERERQNIPHGERYELCTSTHAESNAIISASRREMLGATLYLAGQEADGTPISDTAPCSMCYRLIVNAGIAYIVTRTADGLIRSEKVKPSSPQTGG